MRLNKIKLAGFKSFVDPTTIPLPSNMIGIVGPNGCGKSNIIDAVRWVMGESSAKHLRGDAMTDVIFNGSTSRKPVGQASIELVFDNSDGSLGGQYAQYNEISVKRTVSRDGQSAYYLNGTRCRRRDITDIFLGTGLGPRSYAIIEQGTISRIIEARPEDLRIFLEEAAGISKYKERRRETETRIRHARENLDRLNDLRDELGKQLDRLQRQARTAERYKELKQEERLLKAQLQALRWRALDGRAADVQRAIAEQETALEAEVARQRNLEADIEHQRALQIEATEAFNAVQSRYYAVGADIARLEQSIQHARERRGQQQQDLAQLERALAEHQAHLEADAGRIETLRGSLAEGEPALAQAQQEERQAAAALAEAEQAMHDWQLAWDELNREANEPARQAEAERARIQQLEQHQLQVRQRLSRFEEEFAGQSTAGLEAELQELGEQLSQSEAQVALLQEQLAERQEAIAAQRADNQETGAQLDTARGELQRLRGRQSSLEALQQAALGKRQGATTAWLESQQLQGAPRLAEGLSVEPGWERATECVLGFDLEAVCVAGMEPHVDALDGLSHGALAMFDTGARTAAQFAPTRTPLLTKLQAPWPLDGLLAGVYAAETLADALALRPHLAAHESVVTRDGTWLGAGWLRVTRDPDEKAGVLQREQELKAVVAEVREVAARVEALEERRAVGRERLQHLEEERDGLQQAIHQANRAHGQLQAERSARQARLEQMRSRHERLQAEIAEARQQIGRHEEELTAARGRLQVAVDRMGVFAEQRETLQGQRDELRARLEATRLAARAAREAAHAVIVRTETQRTELASTEQALVRLQAQLEQINQRHEALTSALSENEAPLAEMGDELERLLEARMRVEAELAEARAAVEEIDQRIREQDAARHAAERQAQEIRAGLEQARIGWQELKVRRQTLQEQVAEAGYELSALLQDLPADAEESRAAEQVEEIDRRIQRLGPINLAAIEEFEQQSERKQYLDAQHADLSEALATLEAAIQKIDRETRTRFKETFDKVNAGLQAGFPRLFGGGHAYLELTGEDLLDTGVTVMARPPGKRNSTIHLLSGGEKALTAVALVFAIFELNPAPFCMLDEVDAPLDDANVGRFCDMVKAMSARTQFIFITHNKVTMEVAHHLTGVTMSEPGVSRLVAVDVDEAVQLAAV